VWSRWDEGGGGGGWLSSGLGLGLSLSKLRRSCVSDLNVPLILKDRGRGVVPPSQKDFFALQYLRSVEEPS
jgi:hypothetical protein